MKTIMQIEFFFKSNSRRPATVLHEEEIEIEEWPISVDAVRRAIEWIDLRGICDDKPQYYHYNLIINNSIVADFYFGRNTKKLISAVYDMELREHVNKSWGDY